MSQPPPTAARRAGPRWARRVPALGVLYDYGWSDFRADLLSGLTVAAVAVPQGMAYATIAGLPPEIGLYTAIVTTFVAALSTTSRQLVNGPTNAMSIAVLSVLAPITTPETVLPTAILLTFVVGAIQLGIATLRLGDLSRYVSHSVILGFTAGAGALLILDQSKNLVGITAPDDAPGNFVLRFVETWRQADAIHWPTAVLGVGSIVVIVGLRWLKRKLDMRLLPELLLVIITGAWLTNYFRLEREGVAVVGHIPKALPSFALPPFDIEHMVSLSGGALAVALLGLLEAISMAKALAARTRQRVDMNQQCLSEGLANVTGSFFGCYPGSGSLMRSYINLQAGAVSQWSAVISCAAVATTIMLFAPYARWIPRPALAGILVVSAFRLVDFRSLFYHFRATRFDAAIITATAVSAVFISVEFCILIGVLLSFALAVPRVGRILTTEFVVAPSGGVHERLPEDEPCPQILIFGLEGEMFFGSVASLEQELAGIEARVLPETKVLVLRMKRARNPDAVGLSELERFLHDMGERGVVVLMCGVRGEFSYRLKHTGVNKRLGSHEIFDEQPVRFTSTLQAIERAYELVPTPCANCPRHPKRGKPKPLRYFI